MDATYQKRKFKQWKLLFCMDIASEISDLQRFRPIWCSFVMYWINPVTETIGNHNYNTLNSATIANHVHSFLVLKSGFLCTVYMVMVVVTYMVDLKFAAILISTYFQEMPSLSCSETRNI